MTDKQATDAYWGIMNGNAAGDMSPEYIEALATKLSTLGGEGSAYAANLRQAHTSSKMGNLSKDLLDPSSKFYQHFASYLRNNTPGIGKDTLMAPLMAGGTGYAGGQAIAAKKATGFARERQDTINKGVQGFALGNINVGANLLGQQAQSNLGYAELAEQRRQYDDSQGFGWGDFGSLAAVVAAPFTGGASLAAIPAMQGLNKSPNAPTQGRKSMGNPSGYQYDGGTAGYDGGYSQFWK